MKPAHPRLLETIITAAIAAIGAGLIVSWLLGRIQ